MEAIEDLADRLSAFVAARNWDQFHTPKNLAMALAGEAGELVAEFQWLTAEKSATVMEANPDAAEQIRSELADVTIYLVRLASVLRVDLIDAAHAKIDQNELRYPADEYCGSARKAQHAADGLEGAARRDE